MSLDISAFRSIAAQNPDKLVYVSGEKLKSAKTQGSRGPEVFKAAVDAFIKAYTDHYGAKLGNMSRKSLQEYADGSKPLTASVVSQMLAYADGKMGDKRIIKIGKTEIDLSKVGTGKLGSKGVFRSTKTANAQAGQASATNAVLAALQCTDGGKVDIAKLLRSFNAYNVYVARDLEANRSTDREGDAIKLFEKNMFTAIDALDNAGLSLVYQGLISPETDDFKDEIARIINHPDAEPAVQEMAEKAFTAISRLEAMIVSEMSRRITLAATPEAQRDTVPSLMKYYFGKDAQSANHFGGEEDMTTKNLEVMRRVAVEGSMASRENAKNVSNALKSRGMDNVEARQIGDMIRNNELTVNVNLDVLMGYGSGGAPQMLLTKPGAQLLNTFEVQEMRRRPMDETGYMKHRDHVEKTFFPEYAGIDLKGGDRPRYAAVNTPRYTSGAADTSNSTYGRAVVVLKPHVKKQCTYTLDDTFFVARYSIPPEARETFLEGIVDQCADRLTDKDAALAALYEKPVVTKLLDSLFRKVKYRTGSLFNEKAFNEVATEISILLNNFRKEGTAEFDGYDIKAYLSTHYLLPDADRKVATYDNVENLLATGGDFTAVNMAMATLRKQENPDSPVAFKGVSYIEAQVHGTIRFDRDVEEVRFDTTDIFNHFEQEFEQLSENEKNAILSAGAPGRSREDIVTDWAAEKTRAEIARIKQETKDVPFKVTFYDSAKTFTKEMKLANDANATDRKSGVALMKRELSEYAKTLTAGNRAELLRAIATELRLTESAGTQHVFELYGDDLSRLPAWFDDTIKSAIAATSKKDEKTKLPTVVDRKTFLSDVASSLRANLVKMGRMALALDKAGETDEAVRNRMIKQACKSNWGTPDFDSLVMADIASRKVFADVAKFATETLETLIPGGADELRTVYGGFFSKGSRVLGSLTPAIKTEIQKITDDAAKWKFGRGGTTVEALLERIRVNVVKPFFEKRLGFIASIKDEPFKSEADRRALHQWALNAGKIKNAEEVKGVYHASTRLVDGLEALLSSGAPLTPRAIIAVYKAFHEECLRQIEIDKATNYKDRTVKSYGFDQKGTAFDRATFVALNRLATRVSHEDMARLAALFKTDDMQALYVGAACGMSAVSNKDTDKGEMSTFAVFAQCVYQALPAISGVELVMPDDGQVDYGAIPPGIRKLLQEINAGQTLAMNRNYPAPSPTFKPLAEVSNPSQMPKTLADRKRFLVSMLRIYREHERTFDKGTNYHGRTHATRAFVLSTVMANILKEKGIEIDMNAVALATAGHDTGRISNGKDNTASENRSVDNTLAEINARYPGAAGNGWEANLRDNVAAEDGPEGNAKRTIEGYIFKSADSLDYVRLGDMDMKYLPFLKEPIALPNGMLLMPDEGLRKQLAKEAAKLAELTSPRVALTKQIIALNIEILSMKNSPERTEKQNQMKALQKQAREAEIAQTENLSDEQVVEMVEKAIRDNAADFPLLSQYYR